MTDWTREELLAYILLFAAHSDLKEDNHERNIILSRIDMNTFQNIHDEFDKDNDYQSLQKIQDGLEKHHFSNNDITLLLAEIESLFLSDGKYDNIERNMYSTLEQLFT